MESNFPPEGLTSELGPGEEWIIADEDSWSDTYHGFWEIVEKLILGERGSYEELPDWMTETATDALLNNS